MKRSVKMIGIALSAVIATGLAACGGGTSPDLPAKHRDAANTTVKKGVCVSRYNADDATCAKRIDDLDVGWYYTWGPETGNTHIGGNI